MKKYSYVSLLTNDSYAYGIELLSISLKKVKSKYPLFVLITKDVSLSTREFLNQLDNVTYMEVDTIALPSVINEHNKIINPSLAITWENCWTKLRIYDQTQFDKIVFLDADIMILKNIDHLFDCPHMTAALDGEYFNLWPNWPHFNSGCLIIEPSHKEFENILKYGKSLSQEELPNYVFADQELLNFYYNDWPQKQELHLNKYYNIFPPYVLEEFLSDLQENTFFVHFVGRKPWINWRHNPNEVYSEYYYELGAKYINENNQSLNWEKIRKPLILTVYAICKNEKNNINKWLKCFSEADYICILDTGSTDGTWELLQEKKKEYSNLIISQQIISPWRFDTARNESMKLIPKETDIFFMVDLDEIIKISGWCQLIKDCWTPSFSRGAYKYHRDIDDDDSIIRTISEYRIHNKDWDHYVNIVHENLCHKNGEKRFFIESTTFIPIAVWHYPNKNKQTNYLELCEEQVKRYPDDDLARLQLAIECEIAKEYEKAYTHYGYLITHNTTLQSFEIARCYTGLALLEVQNKNAEAVSFYCREARYICPIFADAYIIEAIFYFTYQQFDISLDLFLNALKFCNESFWCSIYDVHTEFIYYCIGANYLNLQKTIEGLGYLSIAHYLNPNNQDIINDIQQGCQEKLDN